MSITGSEVARTQLVQDKICMNKYNQSRVYCIELSKNKGKDSSDQEEIANQILGDLSLYLTYETIISNLPALLFVLFVASWIDSYIHGRKIVLCMGALGLIGWYSLLLLNSIKFEWNVNYVLVAYLPPVMVGGWSCVWMTVFSYLANTSSKRYRFIKFMLFELTTFIGRPLSTYVCGILLGRGNYHADGNIHNYERVFLFCLGCSVGALFYVILAINENKGHNEEDIENIDSIQIKEQLNISADKIQQMSHKFEISKMFDIKNLKDVFRTALKVRHNKGRAQIWLLYLSMCITILTEAKIFSILYPYTEKVYNWDGEDFSDVKSLGSIVQAVATPLASTLLSGYWKLKDSKLGIIGFIVLFLEDACIGSIIGPLGIYLMFIIGSPASLASLAIRSLLTKIAPESESGKIFALMGALELIFKVIEAISLNSIFQFSLGFFPSLLFQIAAALNFIPLFIFFWIDLTKDQPDLQSE